MRPATAARRETFAAIAFEDRGAIDLRLRPGDERRQAIDADIVRDHRLRLGLRRLELRLRTVIAIAIMLVARLMLIARLVGLALALMC